MVVLNLKFWVWQAPHRKNLTFFVCLRTAETPVSKYFTFTQVAPFKTFLRQFELQFYCKYSRRL